MSYVVRRKATPIWYAKKAVNHTKHGLKKHKGTVKKAAAVATAGGGIAAAVHHFWDQIVHFIH